MAEFRMTITSMCTYIQWANNYSTIRARQTCTNGGSPIVTTCLSTPCRLWEQYHVPTADLMPAIGTIPQVMNLHSQQKYFGKADHGQLTLANVGSGYV